MSPVTVRSSASGAVSQLTGAGDCFAGAFLAAVHHGQTPEDAALAANAVAALTIQQLVSRK